MELMLRMEVALLMLFDAKVEDDSYVVFNTLMDTWSFFSYVSKLPMEAIE